MIKWLGNISGKTTINVEMSDKRNQQDKKSHERHPQAEGTTFKSPQKKKTLGSIRIHVDAR